MHRYYDEALPKNARNPPKPDFNTRYYRLILHEHRLLIFRFRKCLTGTVREVGASLVAVTYTGTTILMNPSLSQAEG